MTEGTSSDYDPSAYPPFAVTVDIIVFTVREGRLAVALIERGNEPFKGKLALPGGFVEPDEDLASAAVRELAEETYVDTDIAHLEQLGAYGNPDRDPRMRVVSVAYWVAMPDLQHLRGGSDAASAHLVDVEEVLADPADLAFDHHTILGDALTRLRRAIEWSPVASAFCGPEFTIGELRSVYEAVWGVTLDPGNFQKKVTDVPGLLVDTGRRRSGERGRPAALYRAGPADEIDPPLRRPEDA